LAEEVLDQRASLRIGDFDLGERDPWVKPFEEAADCGVLLGRG
jgi:hypothetical protein